ncbi:MAG: DUF4276 family protein [Deltaproteobacteria bacterium]|nr:DUF4276 family protein [Deltaproteobacteria bacterium]
MKTIVFFLEEPSAKEMLVGVLPRFLPENIQIRYFVFQGKQDLEKNLKRKLRGWRMPDSVFVVMRDQDSGDCKAIKTKLADLCREAGREGVLVRVACRELESFYLGDLAAVEQGLGFKGLKEQQQGKKFRNPDTLGNPAEELFRLTRNTYDKVVGSRAIAPYLSLEANCSKSFRVLLSGIKNLVKV